MSRTSATFFSKEHKISQGRIPYSTLEELRSYQGGFYTHSRYGLSSFGNRQSSSYHHHSSHFTLLQYRLISYAISYTFQDAHIRSTPLIVYCLKMSPWQHAPWQLARSKVTRRSLAWRLGRALREGNPLYDPEKQKSKVKVNIKLFRGNDWIYEAYWQSLHIYVNYTSLFANEYLHTLFTIAAHTY